jgi:hypothetical protein
MFRGDLASAIRKPPRRIRKNSGKPAKNLREGGRRFFGTEWSARHAIILHTTIDL